MRRMAIPQSEIVTRAWWVGFLIGVLANTIGWVLGLSVFWVTR